VSGSLLAVPSHLSLEEEAHTLGRLGLVRIPLVDWLGLRTAIALISRGHPVSV